MFYSGEVEIYSDAVVTNVRHKKSINKGFREHNTRL